MGDTRSRAPQPRLVTSPSLGPSDDPSDQPTTTRRRRGLVLIFSLDRLLIRGTAGGQLEQLGELAAIVDQVVRLETHAAPHV